MHVSWLVHAEKTVRFYKHAICAGLWQWNYTKTATDRFHGHLVSMDGRISPFFRHEPVMRHPFKEIWQYQTSTTKVFFIMCLVCSTSLTPKQQLTVFTCTKQSIDGRMSPFFRHEPIIRHPFKDIWQYQTSTTFIVHYMRPVWST